MKRRKWEAEKKEREEAEYREKKERAREQVCDHCYRAYSKQLHHLILKHLLNV